MSMGGIEGWRPDISFKKLGMSVTRIIFENGLELGANQNSINIAVTGLSLVIPRRSRSQRSISKKTSMP